MPTPTPTPPPPVATETPPPVYGCGLPRGTGNGRGCFAEHGSFDEPVNASIDQVITEFPEFFDLTRTRGGDRNFLLRNPASYLDEVVYNLRTRGFCALHDNEEVAVKSSNDFNDQYDIITFENFVRRSYVTTCRPAWDAIPPAGDE